MLLPGLVSSLLHLKAATLGANISGAVIGGARAAGRAVSPRIAAIARGFARGRGENV